MIVLLSVADVVADSVTAEDDADAADRIVNHILQGRGIQWKMREMTKKTTMRKMMRVSNKRTEKKLTLKEIKKSTSQMMTKRELFCLSSFVWGKRMMMVSITFVSYSMTNKRQQQVEEEEEEERKYPNLRVNLTLIQSGIKSERGKQMEKKPRKRIEGDPFDCSCH